MKNTPLDSNLFFEIVLKLLIKNKKIWTKWKFITCLKKLEINQLGLKAILIEKTLTSISFKETLIIMQNIIEIPLIFIWFHKCQE